MSKKQENEPNKQPKPAMEQERRQYKRIQKNFILTYFDKVNPSQKYEITQLKNIGMGGMCFITTKNFDPLTEIGIELKTPFLSDVTYLEGKVLESHEKVKNLIYETRLQFDNLTTDASFTISKLVEFFFKGDKKNNA